MRHYDEDMIDFRVSDVWREQYAAQGLTYPAGRYPTHEASIPPTPRGGYSDADGEGWTKVGELIKALNLKQVEIERLKSIQHPPANSRDSFEGI